MTGPTGSEPRSPAVQVAWADAREALRERGLRWTPQRRLILEVLAETSGHITGAELVERCRARDGATIGSTVYRTLDVLEELGYVRHSHGSDGREEYHVLPLAEHAHVRCLGCGAAWDLSWEDARELAERLEARNGFKVALGHVMIGGYCPGCEPAAP